MMYGRRYCFFVDEKENDQTLENSILGKAIARKKRIHGASSNRMVRNQWTMISRGSAEMVEPGNGPAFGIDEADIEKNKGIAAVAYILFFVPLLAAKDSRFATYHANQGLLLLILAVAINVIGGIIPFIGWFLILPLGNLLVFILFVLGLVNALQGRTKPLPLIGGIQIIK